MKEKKAPPLDKDKILHGMLTSNRLGTFFGVSQDVLDNVWGQLTAKSGKSITYISMEIGADPDVFNPVRAKLIELGIDESTRPEVDKFVQRFLHGPDKIPNYGGGLGILAGDTLKSFADCRIPVVGASLLYHQGYFSQLVDSKLGQISWSSNWEPANTPLIYPLNDPDNPDNPLEIEVPFYDAEDRQVTTYARLWLKMEINSTLDFFVPEILLDYHTPSSPDWIKDAAMHLYDSSSEKTKIVQRRMLGAGVVPALQALGITSQIIHLNEQHGVSVVLMLIINELKKKFGENFIDKAADPDIMAAADKVAQRLVYTIHTPVKAGHDRFAKDLFRVIGHSFCQRILNLMAQDQENPKSFNFTDLAMQVNRATNSVSRLHKTVTQKQFPQHADKITAITNGVHHLTWISDAKAELYDTFKELKGWRQNPNVFVNAVKLLENDKFHTYFEDAWQADNSTLVTYINQMLVMHRNQMQQTWIDPPNYLSHLDGKDAMLEPGVFAIGFARRFSTYKRADLIFEDIDTLLEPVLANNWPVYFVFAGKAHPADEPGKSLIKMVLDCQEELFHKSNGLAKLIFIPGYDMKIAKMMISGCHAWLNSPKRPLEASGTSGMKAALNGIPNISIMDGWWAEGYHDGETGWKFGYENTLDNDDALSEHPSSLLYEEDSDSFYKLFPDILQAFYDQDKRHEYIKKCIMNLVLNCPKFNTHRMIAEYVQRYQIALPASIEKKMQRFREMYCSDEDFKG